MRLRFRLVLACLCAGIVVVGGGTATGAPTELFFSEYVEGSSFNKAVEIYNGTGAPVDLGALGYKVELYSNGSPTVSQSVNLSGSLANGDVFVIANTAASPTILSQTDLQNSAVANWNGDDAVVLRKGATIIDVIGQIGNDPGTEWGTGLTSTADNTLRRKASVEAGDVNGADAFDPAAEWDGFAQDTLDGIGAHSLGDAAPTVTATSPLSGATGVTVDANVSLTFGEPVNVTEPWATIVCTSSGSHTAASSGGPTTFTLNPSTDFVAGEACQVTVLAAAVADQDTNDPPNAMAGNYVFSFSTVAPTTGVFFSEYVEGSSNNKAIEVYNGTGAPIDLGAEGYRIELYSNGSATAAAGPLNMTGTLASGDVFVAANPSANATILAQADATSSTAINWNGDDAIVLRKGATVVDVFGQIGFDPGTEWGTGLTSTQDNTLRRKATVGTGDSNGSDAFDPAVEWDGFAVDTFEGLGEYGEVAPRVNSTNPANGATGVARDANVVITFSEPVKVIGNWYIISCSSSDTHVGSVSGGPTTYTIDPTTNFASSETCTVSISGGNVTDVDGDDPPDSMAANHTFTFQTVDQSVCGDPATKIGAIQGPGATAAITGNVSVEGVVVGDFEGPTTAGIQGFYLQDSGDGNSATSDGIFVYTGDTNNSVSAGQVLRVTGFARERFGQTTINGSNSDIAAVTNIVNCGTTGSVTPTDVSMPFAALDAPERYEGMLVRFPQSLVISEYFNYDQFGELVLALPLVGEPRPFSPTALSEPGAPANARLQENLLRRITLDDTLGAQNPSVLRHPNGNPFSLTNGFRGGDLVQNAVGVLTWEFSRYRIEPTAPASYTAVNPRPAVPEPVEGTLRAAAMNTLNFFITGDYPAGNPLDNKCGPANNVECRGHDADQPAEFTRQRDKLLAAVAGANADVLGLNEIENSTGVDPLNDPAGGIVPGVNALLGAGTYAAINTGVIGTDAIRVGLIYKPAKLTPIGAYKVLTTAVDPRFIDTRSRPALAQTFQENATGARFTVIVNHLKSKGSACADIGDPDVGDGQGNCNGTRTNAAKALVDWAATDPTGSGDPDFLIIGDLNSYAMEDPIDAIKAGPDDTAGTADDYTNLVAQFLGPFAYSYTFDGMAGYLDHALSSATLTSQVTGVTEWHINSDEADVLDYDTTFKPPAQEALYEPKPYRTSDHDPIIVGLRLNAGPSVDANGPYSVAEGGSVNLSATGTDPNGDALTYAWDLDNNGTYETAGQTVSFSAALIDGLVPPVSRTVGVRVSDGTASATDTAQVTITNAPPTATFVAPATVDAGNPFTLALTNPADPAPADVAAGFTYAFDCGSGYGPFGAASTRSCPTSDVGVLSVGGKIRDKDGSVTEYRATVRSVVTAASLCALTEQFVTKEGVAHSMCVKLEANSIKAYVNEIEAQAGKSLTQAQAELLIRLARALS